MRLGDFGIAKDFLYTSALEHGAAFCVAGTPLYMAPEVLRGDIAGKSADTWALGCVLHEMVSPGLRAPFVADTLPALVRSIIVDPPSPLVEHAEAPGLVSLIASLLEKSSSERATLDAALVHPLCAPQVERYQPRRLRRSLTRETRLHELLDHWVVDENAPKGKRSSGRSLVVLLPKAIQRWRMARLKAAATEALASASRGAPDVASPADARQSPSAVAVPDAPSSTSSGAVSSPPAASTLSASSPNAGIAVLHMALHSQHGPPTLQRSASTRALRAVVRLQTSARLSRTEAESAEAQIAETQTADSEHGDADTAASVNAPAYASTPTALSPPASTLAKRARAERRAERRSERRSTRASVRAASVQTREAKALARARRATMLFDTGEAVAGGATNALQLLPSHLTTGVSSGVTSLSRASRSAAGGLAGASMNVAAGLAGASKQAVGGLAEASAQAVGGLAGASAHAVGGLAEVSLQAAGGLAEVSKHAATTASGVSKELTGGTRTLLRAALSQMGGSSDASGTAAADSGGAPALPVPLTTYACCDRARRPGQLWLTETHLCFVAARGARVVIHLGRLEALELPSSPSPFSRARRVLILRLNGTVKGGVTREVFYGLFERTKAANALMHQCYAIGHAPRVIGSGAAELTGSSAADGSVLAVARLVDVDVEMVSAVGQAQGD